MRTRTPTCRYRHWGYELIHIYNFTISWF